MSISVVLSKMKTIIIRVLSGFSLSFQWPKNSFEFLVLVYIKKHIPFHEVTEFKVSALSFRHSAKLCW